MTDESFSFSADQFSGAARVFPLPNLVMFPHVMQPLHIFEPRYRAMLEEALEGDRLIAMGLLAPGWEQQSEGRPTLRNTACLCRVATYEQTEHNTYNVLMLGVRRLKLVKELPPKKLFRVVESEILDDVVPDSLSGEDVNDLQKQLLAAFKRLLPKLPDALEQLDQLLGSQITLGMLSDIVAYTMNLDLESKVRLLGECDVMRRTELLLQAIDGRPAGGGRRPFPPPFSAN
jgi:Lon protease-like protein